MRQPSFKERFQYWFDNRMAKGSLGLIRFLVLVTVLVIAAVTLLITAFGLSDDPGATLWNSFATVINAWMPYAEEGDIGYRILMTLAAVAGLLVTSVLIGIFASAIEEKITSLRRGNSSVLESGHIVVLGYIPGEYTLIRQLILSQEGKKCAIVIASAETERDEMEELIAENVEVPKNIRIICRKIDLCDPNSLEKCAVKECRQVVVNMPSDQETTKVLLAVSTLIDSKEGQRVRIGAVMNSEDYLFPETVSRRHNIRTLCAGDIVARIIAHSCTEPGLSETFKDIFNFEGCEFYVTELPAATGMQFSDVCANADGGIPVGIQREGKAVLSPAGDTEVNLEDKIIVFAENAQAVRLLGTGALPKMERGKSVAISKKSGGKLVIIGVNREFETVVRELPENIASVTFADVPEDSIERMQEVLSGKSVETAVFTGDISEKKHMARLIQDAAHVILLNDYEKENDEADTVVIFRTLLLRDLRISQHLSFNITAELRRESNQTLLQNDDGTDFIVASNMSSYFLAQLAENAGGCSVLRELLSNEGSELRLLGPEELGITGPVTVSEIRREALLRGCIFLGVTVKTEHGYENRIALSLSDTVSFGKKDQLILIGDF